MHEAGLDVTAVTAGGHYLTGAMSRPIRWLWRRDRETNGTVIRTWFPKDYRRSSIRRVIGYLAYSLIAPVAALFEKDVDVVFAGTDPPFMTPGAYLVALFHRARLVLDERDVYPETALALGMVPHPLAVFAITRWNSWLIDRAHSLVTVSPGLQELLASRGAPRDKIHVIPNYFPPESSEGDQLEPGLSHRLSHR